MAKKNENIMNIVTLRLYRGKETYNKTGKLTSENQLYKISHNTTDWVNFKKTAAYTFSNAEVLAFNKQIVKMEEEEVLGKLTPVARYSYKEISIPEELKKEVKAIFQGEEKVLTPDQKKIAELEKKIDNLSNGNREQKPNTDEDLNNARAEYKKVFGKKGYAGWTVEQINAKIAEKK